MKVLFINGSPNKNGQTSNILQRIAIQIAAQHDIELCTITEYQMNGCTGCHACQQSLHPTGCIQKDQVSMLLDTIVDADVILYATPCKTAADSIPLQTLLERHTALFSVSSHGDRSTTQTQPFSLLEGKAVAFVLYGTDGSDTHTRSLCKQLDAFCASALTHCIGIYYFPDFSTHTESKQIFTQTIQQIVTEILKI